MTDGRDPLLAFDDDSLGAVADDSGLDVAAVRELVSRHQEAVRALPGVENLVYEWRKTLAQPLVERRADAYVLLIESDVWEEYRDALELTDREFEALRAAHARQFRASVEPDAVERAADGDRAPMILVRP